MGLYKNNKTDPELEQKGIILDYGDYNIRIARAGGSNALYNRKLEEIMKPYRRQVQKGGIAEELSLKLMAKVYAEAVVVDWKTKDEHGKFVKGIEGEDGKLLPFSKANCEKTLLALPDVLKDLIQDASNQGLFLASLRETDTGNSKAS